MHVITQVCSDTHEEWYGESIVTLVHDKDNRSTGVYPICGRLIISLEATQACTGVCMKCGGPIITLVTRLKHWGLSEVRHMMRDVGADKREQANEIRGIWAVT